MSKPAVLFECPPINYWKSNPYALDFSPDGTTLAVGSGGWYGHGGLSLVDILSGTDTTIRFVGIANMDSDRRLDGEQQIVRRLGNSRVTSVLAHPLLM